jgi:hypothetical protein
MSSDTRLSTVGLSSAVLISLDRTDDGSVAARIEEIVEEGGHYIDKATSGWVGGENPDRFLVVFRHDTPMGIARAKLISDLSDRGVRANIDPL